MCVPTRIAYESCCVSSRVGGSWCANNLHNRRGNREKYVEYLQQKAEKDEKKKRKREEERLAERLAIKEALEGLDFS